MHKVNAYNKEDWVTPKYILDALGKFDLDPCCPNVMPWPTAKVMITNSESACTSLDNRVDESLIRGNGMNMDWSGRVWCNPPYGLMMNPWITRMRIHNNGVLLIPNATENAIWHTDIFPYASEICFIKGRVSFCNTSGQPVDNNVSGSVLIAFGNKLTGDLGRVVCLK